MCTFQNLEEYWKTWKKSIKTRSNLVLKKVLLKKFNYLILKFLNFNDFINNYYRSYVNSNNTSINTN